eukprot:s1503_g11.t1
METELRHVSVNEQEAFRASSQYDQPHCYELARASPQPSELRQPLICKEYNKHYVHGPLSCCKRNIITTLPVVCQLDVCLEILEMGFSPGWSSQACKLLFDASD